MINRRTGQPMSEGIESESKATVTTTAPQQHELHRSTISLLCACYIIKIKLTHTDIYTFHTGAHTPTHTQAHTQTQTDSVLRKGTMAETAKLSHSRIALTFFGDSMCDACQMKMTFGCTLSSDSPPSLSLWPPWPPTLHRGSYRSCNWQWLIKKCIKRQHDNSSNGNINRNNSSNWQMQQKQQQLLLQQLTGICLSPQIKLKEEKTHVFHSFFSFLCFPLLVLPTVWLIARLFDWLIDLQHTHTHTQIEALCII